MMGPPTRTLTGALSAIAGVGVILIGGLNLFGWGYDVVAFTSVIPGFVSMNPVTAMAFVLSGMALWLLRREQAVDRRRAAGLLCAAIVTTIGALKLLDYGLGWDLGIDQWLFRDKLTALGLDTPNRMAPNTALNFLLLGAALATIDLETSQGYRPAQYLVITALILSVLALIGYTYGIGAFYGTSFYIPMALNTAVAFALLCSGLLLARPDRGVMRTLTGPHAGGAMARRLLPAVIGVPLAIGWLRLAGQRAGFYGTEFGVALSVIISIIILCALVWWSARALNRMETGRKTAEEERDRFFNLSLDLLCIAGFDDYFKQVNPAWEKTLGWTSAELLAQPYLEFIHPDDRRLTAAEAEKNLSGEHTVAFENRYRCRDGSYKWLSWTAMPSKAQRLIYAAARDITDRKEAEEAIKQLNARLELANKELEAFSYSVAHDLRAPLRTIDGFSQALLEDYSEKLGADGHDSLKRVRAASQRMAQLIDDMLSLSRVTRTEMQHEKVDLSSTAHTIAEELRKTQPERETTVVIAPGVTAEGDSRLLRTVLENLLANAWKFTGKKPKARIEFGVTEQEGAPVYFVRDNGAGFDMAYAEKLFGVFQRLHAMTEFPGTGVGLATVQRIVHRHGGRVWAEGAVEHGATFYFTL